MDIIQISPQEHRLVKGFLDIAGADTLKQFRYFNTRPLEVMKNHLATFIIRHQEQSIAYGHLDQEDGITWLGIAIANDFQGQGLGTLMMTHLLTFARLHEVAAIKLSVDTDNVSAIPLYRKFGFVETNRTEKVVFMEWGLKAD